ncbi:MAG: Ig-like domain-containing protein [Planctomycetes bacterium]|nr:Ig-like domain-containing protein [Planctomycetota bacterium]
MRERSGKVALSLAWVLAGALTIIIGCDGTSGRAGLGRVAPAQSEAFEVAEMRPNAGSTGVAIRPKIFFVFNQDFDFNTVHGGNTAFTFRLARLTSTGAVDPTGVCLTGVLVQTSFREFFFTPDADLDPNRVHRVTLTTGVKSMKGQSLAQAFTATFTTGGGAADTTPPKLIELFAFSRSGNNLIAQKLNVFDSSTPTASQPTTVTGIRADTSVVAIFSEPMDPASMTFSNATLSSGTSTNIPGTVVQTSVGGSPRAAAQGASPVRVFVLLPNQALIAAENIGVVGSLNKYKTDTNLRLQVLVTDRRFELANGFDGTATVTAAGASFVAPSTSSVAISQGRGEVTLKYSAAAANLTVSAVVSGTGFSGSASSSNLETVTTGQDAFLPGAAAVAFVPAFGESGETFTVTLGTGLKDGGGNGLDQNSTEAGLQGAIARFQTETLWTATDLALNTKTGATKHETIALAAGDVNGDSLDDLVALMDHEQPGNVDIDYLQTALFNSSGNAFATPVNTGGTSTTDHLFDPQNIRVTDVDQDGNRDLVFDRNNVNNLASASGQKKDVVTFLHGPPIAGVWGLTALATGPDFQNNLDLGGEVINPNDLLLATLDTGSDPDIVTANGIAPGNPTGSLSAFLGSTGKTFASPRQDVTTSPGPTGAGAVEIDAANTSVDDVIVATTEQLSQTTATTRVEFYANNGSGTLAQLTSRTITLGTATNMVTSDLEAAKFQDGSVSLGVGDFVVGIGRPNLFAGSQTNELQVFAHDHDAAGAPIGTVSHLQTLGSPSGIVSFGPSRIRSFDFDADGDLDLVVTNSDRAGTADGLVCVYRNMGKDTSATGQPWRGFSAVRIQYRTGQGAHDVATLSVGSGAADDFAVTNKTKLVVFKK